MSSEKVVSAQYEVSIEKLASLGVSDPYSVASLQIYASGKLTSDERLYFTLWGCQHLSAANFSARQLLATRGAEVSAAYFIVRGRLLGVEGEKIYRLGPGSIIGLAEGLAHLPYSMTVVCVTDVEARLIPLSQVDRLVPRMPLALRGILRSAVVRTLGLDKAPESLE
ncbi:MAG: Crp/Fnr family transcriptional regulator [Burkholderiaceae bacterium]|jgi:CRP-like cAMP-binding protein